MWKQVDDRKVLSGIIHVLQKGLLWVDAPAPQNPLQPLPPLVRQGCFDLIFSELSASDAPEPEVLMLDATDVKAHPTASSLTRGGVPRLIGGAKGVMTSKLHGVCHSKGGPLRLHLNERQCSDFIGASVLLKDLPPAATVMGDKGYDRDKTRKMLAQQGITLCIPPRHCRKKPVHCNKRLDRKGHKIGNLFSRLKH